MALGTSTPNLGLYRPVSGETGWGDLVNGNANTIDSLFSAPGGNLIVSRGGTGVSSPTAGGLLIGNGTLPMTVLGPGLASSRLIMVGSQPQWLDIAAAASVATAESTTSATYTNLATVGPTVTTTVTANGSVFVVLSAMLSVGATPPSAIFMGVDISGATTVAASDAFALGGQLAANMRLQCSIKLRIVGLNAGTTTFTAKYRSDGTNTATFSNRQMWVERF
jgi:hypothetical protein